MGGYWFPTLLLLPSAHRPILATTRRWILDELSEQRLREVLTRLAGLIADSSVLSASTQEAIVLRARALHARLKVSEAPTLQELALAAVPEWQRDLAEALLHPDTWALCHIANGEGMSFFRVRYVLRVLQYSLSKHPCTVIASAIAALAAIAGIVELFVPCHF